MLFVHPSICSLTQPTGPIQSISCYVHELAVCLSLETLLPGGLDTYGQREYCNIGIHLDFFFCCFTYSIDLSLLNILDCGVFAQPAYCA